MDIFIYIKYKNYILKKGDINMSNVLLMAGANRTLYFKESNIDKHAHNTAAENNSFVINVAKHNPENTYYVIMLSDVKKITKEQRDSLPKNLVFVLDELGYRVDGKYLYGEQYDKDKIYEKLNSMVDYLNEVGIDYGIQLSNHRGHHLPETLYKKKEDKHGTSLVSDLRSSMYSLYCINNMNFPFIVWNVDDRFLMNQSGCMLRHENACIGFDNYSYKSALFEDFSLETQRKGKTNIKEIPIIYNGVDTLMLTTKNFTKIDRNEIKFEDKNGLLMFINPSPNYDRYADIEKYIIPYFDETMVEIHGDWFDKKPETKNNPMFKGKKAQNETMERLKTAKYTFVLPSHFNNKKTPCSTKPWEAIYYKVIPFMHKQFGENFWKEYHNIPDFLWIENEDELYKKIKFLEENPGHYKALWTILEKCIKPEFLDFSHINEVFKDTVIKYCNVAW